MTFGTWKLPTWLSPWEITIGHSNITPMQSFTQSLAKKMEYTALMKDLSLQPLWKRGFGNKVGCLFQGIHDIPGTDTCLFVDLTNIPKNRKITYGKIVCDYKPNKNEKECVMLTVGGDR
jgi:hypothetical protein